MAGRVHCFDPMAGLDRAYEMGTPVGCVALRDDGRLAVAAADALLTLDPETGAIETLVPFERVAVAVRCNDGKCDPLERLWIDRMAFDRAAGAGTLVRFDGSRFETILGGLTIPNGLAWSGDGRRMYFVDSHDPVISVLDFDMESGAVERRRPFVRLVDVPEWPRRGVPDGLTVDAEDCVWAAAWAAAACCGLARTERSSAASRCRSRGQQLLLRRRRPERAIHNHGLGGRYGRRTRRPANAGGLFRARPGVRGRPARRCKIGVGTPGDVESAAL